jgi:site-specific recombinase XerD
VRSFARFNRRLTKRYDDWMIAMHYSPETKHAYQRTLRRFGEFLGKKSISSVTHLDVRQFITRVSEDGASLDAAYRHLTVLRRFYDFLNLGGVVSYVAPRLVRLRNPRREPCPLLSEIQIQQLIAATLTPRERALVEFLYGTGCRVSEARHLKVEDVDFAGGTARVTGKFQKVRTVLLTLSAVEALRKYVGNRQSGYVFQVDRPTQKGCLVKRLRYWYALFVDYKGPGPQYPHYRVALGRDDAVSEECAWMKFNRLLKDVNLVRPRRELPLSRKAILKAIQRVGDHAGMRNVGPHMLRRSFATHLYDNGASLEIVQTLLGHRYLDTTRKYTRLSTGRILKSFHECHPREKMHGEISHHNQLQTQIGRPE